jgi:hypothetical protein
MNTYTFYWLDGTKNYFQGDNALQAFKLAGFGPSALKTLDFHAEGFDNNYEYLNGSWVRKVMKEQPISK